MHKLSMATPPTASSAALAPSALLLQPAVGCDNDWQTWWVGSRTQWNVTKDFYMGVDVLYTKIESANFGASTVLGGGATVFANTARASGTAGALPQSDVDNFSVPLPRPSRLLSVIV